MIVKKHLLIEPRLTEQLWQLYKGATAEMEVETPFKQIIEREEYAAALSDDSFIKFVLYNEDEPVGIGMVATDVSKVLWLSPPYFTHKYGNREVHYLLGIVVSKSMASHSRMGAKLLVQAAIDNSPPDGVICYDFSQKLHSTNFGNLIAKKNICAGEVTDSLSFWEGEHLQS